MGAAMTRDATPAQQRRRLLTRYAIRAAAAGADSLKVRAELARMAAEFDAAERSFLVSVLAHIHNTPGIGVQIGMLCRERLRIISELQLSGPAIEQPELPKHIRPYPELPEEPVALKVGLPQAPEMQTTVWLDAVSPDDLEAIAAWLRKRRTGTIPGAPA